MNLRKYMLLEYHFYDKLMWNSHEYFHLVISSPTGNNGLYSSRHRGWYQEEPPRALSSRPHCSPFPGPQDSGQHSSGKRPWVLNIMIVEMFMGVPRFLLNHIFIGSHIFPVYIFTPQVKHFFYILLKLPLFLYDHFSQRNKFSMSQALLVKPRSPEGHRVTENINTGTLQAHRQVIELFGPRSPQAERHWIQEQPHLFQIKAPKSENAIGQLYFPSVVGLLWVWTPSALKSGKYFINKVVLLHLWRSFFFLQFLRGDSITEFEQ